jgi:GNAT superfamily N-acetyltransferase
MRVPVESKIRALARLAAAWRSCSGGCGSGPWLTSVMDQQAVLAAFEEQVRKRPACDAPDDRVEHDEVVVRFVSREAGWSAVTWSDLSESDADAVIAAQIARFAELGVGAWEWKHYSHDRPSNLAERLLAAGFTPEPAEAVMVAETAELALDETPPEGVELRPVTDADGVDALVSVHDEVFGEDHSALGRTLLARLAQRPSTVAAVVAMAGRTAISAGRVEFHMGSDFASLWGGGTLAAYRGRGVFRALVGYRAALASARGFRYLQVDASPASRPILERLGFVELATTTPFNHPGPTI